MMFRILLCTAVVLFAEGASAGEQLLYGPAPSWVVPTPIPNPPAEAGAAAQLLLQDQQTKYGGGADEFYSETAFKLATPQALSGAGNISLAWSPDTETLTINRLNIIRDGKIIDLLAGGKKFTVIRRETNLDLAMLDGALTATIQPEDIRVGDIIDLVITKQRHDPVYQGRSEGGALVARPGVVGRVHFRQIWPTSKPMRWQATEDLGHGELVRHGEENELSFDLTNVEAPKPPKSAPLRFTRLGLLEMTQFTDWAEVSRLMTPLYVKAATLDPKSPLLAEIAKIKAASPSPTTRAEMALRLVQDQVRYVALLMNLGGFTPTAADLTWSRRFGDCKAKTALLLALLNGLGIEAEPALVNSQVGDILSEQMPMLGSFDHVIVRATIGGKVYWLDGTRLGDRHLQDIRTPDFDWALPVQPAEARLEKLEQIAYAEPTFEVLLRLDASAGLDAPAPAHLEYLYRGDSAVTKHLGLAAINQTDADRSLREMWTKQYPWITAQSVSSKFDDDRRVLRLTLEGSAKMDWSGGGSVRDFQIDESNLAFDPSFRREPGPHQDAPYSVNFPRYVRWLVTVVLPHRGAGFTVFNAPDVDRAIAGVFYHRVSGLHDGVATMDAFERSIAPEFPAKDAEANATALRDLTRTDVVIRYSAPIVDDAETTSADAGPPPTDAAGFSQRGVNHLLKRDLAEAISDLTQAIKLDPKTSSHFYNRGIAYLEGGQVDLAIADFNAALDRSPTDALALLARGQGYLAKGREPQARRDLDAAVKESPGNYQVQFRRAEAYRRSGRFDQAIGYYTEIVDLYPGSEHESALTGRCRSRLGLGLHADEALADCEAALHIKPTDLNALQGRGDARLKLKRYDDAIADFNAVLASRPSDTAALCSRSLAQLAKGGKAGGQADPAASGTVCKRMGSDGAGGRVN